jgi:uroporphyrin-3 C-methyltransferase
VLSLLALGLSIGLAATAYFSWHELQQLAGAQSGTEARLENRIEPLRAALDNVGRTLRDERQQIDGQLKKLAEKQQSMGDRVSVLAALMGRSEQGWSLVRAVDPVDVDGISAKLSALMEAIDELVVRGSKYQPAVKTETVSSGTATTVQDWRELPALLWSSLSGLFRIREHDKPVSPMLPPEREYFLRENLRLQLSAARLALLRDDNVQYRATLTTAADWLEAYFSAQDARVNELREQLEQLSAIDVAPQLPDISASLRLLRQQLKLGTQQSSVSPVVPDAARPEQPPATEKEQALPERNAEIAP